jgi:hypothetical protein
MEDGGLQFRRRLALNLQWGSVEAAPGSQSTVARRQPPSKMVVGRPLPPSSPSASVSSGRRAQVILTSRLLCRQGGPSALVQLAPGASSQVVMFPATVPLAARRRTKAVVKELC